MKGEEKKVDDDEKKFITKRDGQIVPVTGAEEKSGTNNGRIVESRIDGITDNDNITGLTENERQLVDEPDLLEDDLLDGDEDENNPKNSTAKADACESVSEGQLSDSERIPDYINEITELLKDLSFPSFVLPKDIAKFSSFVNSLKLSNDSEKELKIRQLRMHALALLDEELLDDDIDDDEDEYDPLEYATKADVREIVKGGSLSDPKRISGYIDEINRLLKDLSFPSFNLPKDMEKLSSFVDSLGSSNDLEKERKIRQLKIQAFTLGFATETEKENSDQRKKKVNRAMSVIDDYVDAKRYETDVDNAIETKDLGDGLFVYIEGWADKCLEGTGFVPIEEGDWDRKTEYMKEITPIVAKKKAKELGCEVMKSGFKDLDGDSCGLYGFSWVIMTGNFFKNK